MGTRDVDELLAEIQTVLADMERQNVPTGSTTTNIPKTQVTSDNKVTLPNEQILGVKDTYPGKSSPQSKTDSVTASDPQPVQWSEPADKKVKKGKSSVLSDILFYLTIAILIVCGTMYGGLSSGAPKSFAGYSAFTVLTSSMQSEIPKGSLVITKATEPSELQVGDDITYLVDPTTTVTHRIVGIIENYENTGQRAFQTKGIMNDTADKLPVPAVNVIGRVIYHNHTMGKIATFVTDNIVSIIVFLVIFIIFFSVFKKVLGKKRR